MTMFDLLDMRTAVVRLHQSSSVVDEVCSELGCSDSDIKWFLESEYDLWLQSIFCESAFMSAIEFKEHLKKMARKLLLDEIDFAINESDRKRQIKI